MNTIKYKIKEGQYLSDIMEFIPQNAIIDKTLPGLGATYCEIIAKRNSIIIEPNVPVIEGKMEKHKDVLGVFEGVQKKDIIDYLRGSVQFKKIITTPESYHKIQGAFKFLKINYYDTYFLLFDECEKMIRDIDFRETIISPMIDFWKFEKKAFISATPIKSNDPKFKKQDFVNIIIEPDYCYQKDILLIKTNNVLGMVREFLIEPIKDIGNVNQESYCFFINSTDMISSIIESSGIKEFSNIYGSHDCVSKLTDKGFINVTSSLTKLNIFNFFTSRFFSAVDIELDFKPHVVIVTDVEFAPFSMVIPQIDSVQIVGRFRNNMVKSITHITNTDNTMVKKSIDDVKDYIKGAGKAYEQLFGFYKQIQDEGGKALLKQALDRVEFKKFITLEKEINWFAIDNELLEQWVINAYNNFSDLLAEYESSSFFKVTHADFTSFNYLHKSKFKKDNYNKKERRKEIVAQLDLIDFDDISHHLSDLEELEKEDELIVKVYLNKELGKKYIEEVDYNSQLMNIALIKVESHKSKNDYKLLDAINISFTVGQTYTAKEIKSKLHIVYEMFNVPEKAKGTSISDFFEISERMSIGGKGIDPNKRQKGYKIIRRKFALPSKIK